MSVVPEPSPSDAGPASGGPSVGEARRGARLRFDGLRLNGFKSFAEAVEIRIEPGLTGIVGPNGCGKSNLLEGMRWVMGETSAAQMRGEGMDDMIFNGTEERPPRNVADVAILLSGKGEGIPSDEEGRIEVTRRIERGQGTRYRINGRDALQRTVQVLFQDAAVGARSAAIISQGRVTALMLAKPTERRGVLEDAAGLGGLKARRKDFQRRIAGIEENLIKADAELATSGAVLTTLRRQARQAQRHREIGQRVREALALALHLRHAAAAAAEDAARRLHGENEDRVAVAMLAANAASAAREAAVSALGPTRDARVAAEGRVARAEAAIAGIAREIERISQSLSAAKLRVIEATADARRTEAETAEAEARAVAFREERLALAAERAEEGDAIEAASEAVEEARQVVAEADRSQEEASRLAAAAEAARKAAERALADAVRRAGAADARAVRAQASMASAAERAVPADELERAVEEARDAAEAAEAAEEASLAATEETARAEAAAQAAEERLDAARAAATRLRAEGEGLRSSAGAAGSRAPVASRLKVAPGWEAAVAAALGAAALAGTDPAEGAWWGSPTARAPAHAETLAAHAGGVPEVEAFLGSVLVMDDPEGGGIPFGFSGVARDGRILRWDGFRRSGGEDAVRSALERANRLAEVEAALIDAEAALSAALALRDGSRAALSAAREGDLRCRAAARAAAARSAESRDALARLKARQSEADARVSAARIEAEAAEAERAEAASLLSSARAEVEAIPADHASLSALSAARTRVAAAREREATTRALLSRAMAEAAARKSRIEACIREEAALAKRLGEIRERRADLSGRLEDARAAVEELTAQQEDMAEGGVAAAQDEHDAAREDVGKAREAEARGEAERERADGHWRRAEEAVGALREERARLLGAVDLAVRERSAAEAEVQGQLACQPGEALGLARVPDGEALPDAATASARLARLERERDSLGEINFLAEVELSEQEARFGGLERDRSEMRETLQGLTGALRRVEDEARERLRKAFAEIDGHFGRLFSRLFGGGSAHLRLVGSEDLLESGLEIYASPPGKRLQVMSLLSGGEQAMAAMSLVFAAFLANPAPVCVCDEIDAALDDINVDSLVSLMEDMAQGDSTRFLCITHKPLTMARMQRLYGVTMMERGVTSVTRVDLDRAIEIAPRPERH